METKLTIRQIFFLFLFSSITSIFNYIPNTAAANGGGSGYISVIYAGVILFLYACLLLQVLKCYPDKDLYEILTLLVGKVVTKGILFLYGIWAFYCLVMKIGSYSVTLQATLMPSIHSGILISILFLLVIYALTKNNKTIFRFAEFSYQPVFFFLFLLFLFALPSLDYEELVPVTGIDLIDNFMSLPDLCAISGNLVIILFFIGRIAGKGNYEYIKHRAYNTVFVYTMITLLATIVSIGLNGAGTTLSLAYPIFQSVKSISIFQTFERFDAFITLICVLSDYVMIMTLLIILMKCLEWVFSCKHTKIYGAVLFFLAISYILIRNFTQYEFNQIYRNYQVYINLIFQYIVPVILGLVCFFKSTGTKNEPKKELKKELRNES